LRSVHHTFSLLLLPPQGEDSSRSAPAPAWGPSHGRQSSMNFSSLSPSQEQAAPAWVPHGVTGPPKSLLQHGLSMGSQPPLGTAPCSGMGSSLGCRWVSAPAVDLHGLQGHSLAHCGLLHGLQGNLCSSTWSTSCPSFSTDLEVCRVVALSWSHLCLLLQMPLHRFFSPS